MYVLIIFVWGKTSGRRWRARSKQTLRLGPRRACAEDGTDHRRGSRWGRWTPPTHALFVSDMNRVVSAQGQTHLGFANIPRPSHPEAPATRQVRHPTRHRLHPVASFMVPDPAAGSGISHLVHSFCALGRPDSIRAHEGLSSRWSTALLLALWLCWLCWLSLLLLLLLLLSLLVVVFVLSYYLKYVYHYYYYYYYCYYYY